MSRSHAAQGLAEVVKTKVPKRMLGYLHGLFHRHDCECLSLKKGSDRKQTGGPKTPSGSKCLGTQEMLIAETRKWFALPVDSRKANPDGDKGSPQDRKEWRGILKFLENFNALADEMWEAPRKVEEGDVTALFDRRPFLLFPTVDYAFPLINMFMSALVGYVRLMFIIDWWNEEGLVSKQISDNRGLAGLNQAFDGRYGGTKTNEGDSGPDWEAIYERICQGHRLKVYKKFCPVCLRQFYNMNKSYRDVKGTIQEYAKGIEQQGGLEPKCRHVDRPCTERLGQDSNSGSVVKIESNASEKNMECMLQYTYYRLIHHNPSEVVDVGQIPPLQLSFAVFFDQGYIDRVKSIVIPILYDILPYVLDYLRNPRFNWSVLDVVSEPKPTVTERQSKGHLIYSRLRDMVDWIIASDALLGISNDGTGENIRLKHYLQCLYSETLYFVICRDNERDANNKMCPEYVRADVLIRKFRKIKKRIRAPLAQDVPVRKLKRAKHESKSKKRSAERMAAEVQKERPWEEIYQRLGSLSTLLRKAGFWLAEKKAQEEEKRQEEEKKKFRIILSLLGLASFEVLQPLRDPWIPGKGSAPAQISLKKERYYHVAALYHYDIIRHMDKMRDGLYSRAENGSKKSIMDKAMREALRDKEKNLCELLNASYVDQSSSPALETDQDKKDVADLLSLWRWYVEPVSGGTSEQDKKPRTWVKAKVEEMAERSDKEWVFLAMAATLRLCLRRMSLSVENERCRSLIFDQYTIIQDLSAIIFLTEFTRDPCAFIDDIMGVQKMGYLKYDDAMRPAEKSMVHPEERIYAAREKAVSWTGEPQKGARPKEQMKSLFDWDFLEFVESTMILPDRKGKDRQDSQEVFYEDVFYESVHSLMTTGTSTTSSATDALTNWTRQVMSAQGLQYFMSRMIISTLPLLQKGMPIDFSAVLAGKPNNRREVVSTYTSFVKGDLVDPTEDISRSLDDASQSEEKKKEKNRNVKPWEFPGCDVKSFVHECPDAYFIHYFEMLSRPNTQSDQTDPKSPDVHTELQSQSGQTDPRSPDVQTELQSQSDKANSKSTDVQTELQSQLTDHRKTFIAHLFGTNAMHSTEFGTKEEDLEKNLKNLWDLMRIGRTANISTIVKYVTKEACKFDLGEHELYKLTEEKEMEEKKKNMLDNIVKTIMFVAESTYSLVDKWKKEKEDKAKKEDKDKKEKEAKKEEGSVTMEEKKWENGDFHFYNTMKHSLTGLEGLPQGILQVLWEGRRKKDGLEKTKASVVKLIRQLRDKLHELKSETSGSTKTKKKNDTQSKESEKKDQWRRAMVNLIIDEILNVSDEITCTTISEYVYIKEHLSNFITPVFGRLARSHIERELHELRPKT